MRSGASWLLFRLAGDAAQQFGWRFAVFVPAAVLFVIWILFPLSAKSPEVWVCRRSNSTRRNGMVIAPGTRPPRNRRLVARVLKSCAIGWLGYGDSYFLIQATAILCFNESPIFVANCWKDATSGIPGSMSIWRSAGTRVGDLFPIVSFFKSRRITICVIALSASPLHGRVRFVRRGEWKSVSVCSLAFIYIPDY